MKIIARATLAAALTAGALFIAAPPAHAATDLGRADFTCSSTSDYDPELQGTLTGDGSIIYVWGEVGDTFDLDEDSDADCLILNAAGQSVNTVADLGFVSEGAHSGGDTFATNPLRILDNDTVQLVIQGPGIFLIQTADLSYYTVIVNGGVTPGSKDLTVWYQSIARGSADATCPEGYNPSWAQWPNDGAGGWVCNRDVLAYYPWETAS